MLAVGWARHQLPIYPVVVYIKGESKGQGRGLYRQTLLGSDFLTFRYCRVGLSALEAAKYVGQGSALAAALASTMNRGRWGKAEQKARCLRAVAKSKSNEAQKGVAVNHIETYLKLEGQEAQQFETLLKEEEYMEANEIHLTWFEEVELKGIAKGRQEGRQEGLVNGQRRLLAMQLARKFGSLSPGVLARLDALSTLDALEALGEQVLTATSLQELGLE